MTPAPTRRRLWIAGLVLAPALPLALAWRARQPPGPDGPDEPDDPDGPGGPDSPGAPATTGQPPGLHELAWPDLLPPGSPAPPASASATTSATARLARLRDTDPEAQALLQEHLRQQQQAPVRSELDGRPVRITGYVVPLEFGWQGVREFLLVPYYGACIHSPPPPPNQVVHVRAAERVKGLRAMGLAQASGVLRVRAGDSAMGASGYQLDARQVRPLAGSTRGIHGG